MSRVPNNTAFPFQYGLPDNTLPFAIVQGGISQLPDKIRSCKVKADASLADGEINWLLKNHQTNQVFAVRQTQKRENGHVVLALQSEQPLAVGQTYETLLVSSAAPQATILCDPKQPETRKHPSYGMSFGTHIMSEHGEIRVENLRPGMRLVTRDHGMQRLQWIGITRKGAASQKQVRFQKGSIANSRDLMVCPNQLIVLKGAQAMMRFGKREVFAPALAFVNDTDVTLEHREQQNFMQLLLADHEVIYAEAAACESLLPSVKNLSALPLTSRLDIHLLMPELQASPTNVGPMALSHIEHLN